MPHSPQEIKRAVPFGIPHERLGPLPALQPGIFHQSSEAKNESSAHTMKRSKSEAATFFSTNYQVATADSEASALLLAKTEYFDLYLLGGRLTHGDPLELCRQLLGFDPNTPVAFYAGVPDPDERRKAFSAGAQAYFATPVDYFAQQDAVEKLILSAEVRALDAKMAEIKAISDEIKERLSSISFSLREQEIQSLRAQDRAMKLTAAQAFGDAGGTRAGSERLWPQTYDALNRIQNDA